MLVSSASSKHEATWTVACRSSGTRANDDSSDSSDSDQASSPRDSSANVARHRAASGAEISTQWCTERGPRIVAASAER